MNKEKIEILIVMVVLLVLSYAVCGCKDKAEVKDSWGDFTITENFEPPDKPEPNEPNEPTKQGIFVFNF